MDLIPFEVIDWSMVSKTIHAGQQGEAIWKTFQFQDFRMRLVEYSAGYLADHWCSKGHLVYCIEGEFESELKTGESFILKTGMSYMVSDDLSEHRSSSKTGVKLLIIDGNFLRIN